MERGGGKVDENMEERQEERLRKMLWMRGGKTNGNVESGRENRQRKVRRCEAVEALLDERQNGIKVKINRMVGRG